MSGSLSDLNLSTCRSSQGGAAQGEGECKLPSEAEIFRLFYPDGHIPVEHLGNLSEMRSHVSALLSLASGKPGPKIQRKILSREGSQAINQQIAHLKDTPKEDGKMRTWSEIALMVGWGISENACHKRYRAWKQQLKRQQQADRAALRSAAGTGEAAIPEATNTLAVQEHSLDQAQQEFEQVARPAAALHERPEPDENQAIPENNIAKKSEDVAKTKWDPGNEEGPFPDGRRVQGIITGSRLNKRKGKDPKLATDETLRNVPAASSEVQQKPETAPCRQELQETKPVQSHEAQGLEPKAPQNSKQVSSAATVRVPKIPHSEDNFILKEHAGGKKFREIHEALQARGIKCKLVDVITRHYSLLKKVQAGIEAESKAPELQQSQTMPAPVSEPIKEVPPGISPEDLKWILDLVEMGWSAEEISQELSQNGVSVSAEQIAGILAGSKKEEKVKKPEPKRFRKGELDATIWKLHTKEQLSPEEISARLQEDGYSYEVGTIRARLKAQGARI
jgi:hypothetical protein